MNSARWLNERTLLATIARLAVPAAPVRRPWTRNFAAVARTTRTSGPGSLLRSIRTARSSRMIPPSPHAQSIRQFRANSSKFTSNPTPHLGSPQPTPSLSQRLKKLSREYGWSALGVYLTLSALDFPFCFLAVRLLGTDRIGRWEHTVLGVFWDLIRIPFPDFVNERQAAKAAEASRGTGVVSSAGREGGLASSGSIVQAEADNSGSIASLWTQLVLAYAIHKSFIFIRVPLTAAITPKVVKTLRGWGWDIGKRKPKPSSQSS